MKISVVLLSLMKKIDLKGHWKAAAVSVMTWWWWIPIPKTERGALPLILGHAPLRKTLKTFPPREISLFQRQRYDWILSIDAEERVSPQLLASNDKLLRRYIELAG